MTATDDYEMPTRISRLDYCPPVEPGEGRGGWVAVVAGAVFGFAAGVLFGVALALG